MYWNWQISVNDYYVQKMCFYVSMSISLSLFSCLQNHLDLAHRNLYICCERESFPLLRLSPWSRWCPGCSQRHPLGAQDRCLPNAFPRVLVEALLTLWRRRPGKLGTNR